MMTRKEHLAWCKERALEYVGQGDLPNAFASLHSDLSKHVETQDALEINTMLGLPQFMGGMLNTPWAMRNWIEGFN